MEEIWKPVVYKGRKYPYIVSNMGRLKGLSKGNLLKQMAWANGYTMYKLCDNGHSIRVQVHRLVAIHFISAHCDFDDLQVNHKNGDKHDNRVSNLEWVTQYENIKHASDNGIHNGVAYQKVLAFKDGEPYGVYNSLYSAGKDTGVNVGNISQILSGKFKQAKGFTFTRA